MRIYVYTQLFKSSNINKRNEVCLPLLAYSEHRAISFSLSLSLSPSQRFEITEQGDPMAILEQLNSLEGPRLVMELGRDLMKLQFICVNCCNDYETPTANI